MDNENKTTTNAEISEQKLAANQLNAQKSTGPRTAAGKNKSKFNALKHGLRAKELVIPALGAGENQKAYNELLDQLWEQWAPQGILEEMQVEEIAVCYLKRLRVHRYETGEINRQIEEARRAQIDKQRSFAWSCRKGQPYSDEFKLQMKQSSEGLEHLISVLRVAKDLVKIRNSGDQLWLKLVSENFGYDDYIFVHDCTELEEELNALDPNRPAYYRLPRPRKRCEMAIRSLLDEHQQSLKSLLELVRKNEQRYSDMLLASLAVPNSEVMDRIIRYETAINRQMYRAISELERLQRQRKGEPVLPRINVDITGQN